MEFLLEVEIKPGSPSGEVWVGSWQGQKPVDVFLNNFPGQLMTEEARNPILGPKALVPYISNFEGKKCCFIVKVAGFPNFLIFWMLKNVLFSLFHYGCHICYEIMYLMIPNTLLVKEKKFSFKHCKKTFLFTLKKPFLNFLPAALPTGL